MASFLAAILSSRDQAPLVTNALQLVELLLVKMPDAYQYFFRREGVLHEIERIAAAPLVSTKASKRSSESAPSGIARSLQEHAFDPVLPATAALSSAEAQAQDAITLRARHLEEQYAAADSEPALKAKTALDAIRAIVRELDEVVGTADRAKAKALAAQVAGLFSDERNPLSSFELLESGLVDGLLRFATETGSDSRAFRLYVVCAENRGLTRPLAFAVPTSQRQELLAMALMPQLEHGNPTPAFAVLVKRLQDSLSRMEQFEVTLAAPSSSDCAPLFPLHPLRSAY